MGRDAIVLARGGKGFFDRKLRPDFGGWNGASLAGPRFNWLAAGGEGFRRIVKRMFRLEAAEEIQPEILCRTRTALAAADFVVQMPLALDIGILERICPGPELTGAAFGPGYQI
jgi:hypothetical protein